MKVIQDGVLIVKKYLSYLVQMMIMVQKFLFIGLILNSIPQFLNLVVLPDLLSGLIMENIWDFQCLFQKKLYN